MELECEADYPENTHDTSIWHNTSERIPLGSLSRVALTSLRDWLANTDSCVASAVLFSRILLKCRALACRRAFPITLPPNTDNDS